MVEELVTGLWTHYRHSRVEQGNHVVKQLRESGGLIRLYDDFVIAAGDDWKKVNLDTRILRYRKFIESESRPEWLVQATKRDFSLDNLDNTVEAYKPEWLNRYQDLYPDQRAQRLLDDLVLDQTENGNKLRTYLKSYIGNDQHLADIASAIKEDDPLKVIDRLIKRTVPHHLDLPSRPHSHPGRFYIIPYVHEDDTLGSWLSRWFMGGDTWKPTL